MARLSPMTDEDYARLRQFMKARRLAMGLPQTEMSLLMGKQSSYGSQLENGSALAHRPSLPIVKAWAEVLRLEPTALLVIRAPELREPFMADLLNGGIPQ